MPPRKEPKETVVYAASKRKAPPFKPQRPSKVPRTESQDDGTQSTQVGRSAVSSRNTSIASYKDGGTDVGQGRKRSTAMDSESSDSEEELAANPLATIPKPTKATRPFPARRKPSRQSSPVSVSSEHELDPDPGDPPSISQSDLPTIPQALLVRLLHEHFADKKTKIDKDAIQVLQRYFEVFVREAIARTQLQKEQDAESDGKAGEVDVNWLELEDLEKVAAGMLLDF